MFFPNYFLPKMTKIIGLTGGIGSGKSTIAEFFRGWGVPVYIADDEARRVMEDPHIIAGLRQLFGDLIFDANGLNRKKLAEIVFANPEQLQSLNALVHPAVHAHFVKWLAQHNEAPFVIKEAAILFESGSYKDCDAIITVTAPLEERIQRVMKRDQSTRSDIVNRINNQWDDARKIANSDYVIDNTTREVAWQQSREIYDNLHNCSTD